MNFDRFGGAEAWDQFCREEDAYLEELKDFNPGCLTCLNSNSKSVSILKETGDMAVFCEKLKENSNNYRPCCGYADYEPLG